jgi:hypothetical protein
VSIRIRATEDMRKTLIRSLEQNEYMPNHWFEVKAENVRLLVNVVPTGSSDTPYWSFS